ncbi:IclR family transcriptional regulator [Fusibacter ferrireducens]|uniref:IclR family transcriptional regulator n=1 Tax=Fusibacter ferrireducens TaxID=2785058 RepID=A0ABR9ZUZ0_9FIRM|nr:IclR family transcriptional regulator [Fusibacter ferrireducens]MBF4694282.1 IclR family transcriptional regulator [Fusibacter ferrireducens]
MDDKKGLTIRSIDRALEILDCFLGDQHEFTLNEIAEKVSLSPSTTYRLLNTIAQKDYLSKNSNKKYSLGPKMAILGSLCSEMKYDHLVEAAKIYMDQLNKKYDESISLYTVEGDNIICIERFETTRALKQAIGKGDCLPLVSGASGKLLLAYEPINHQRKLIGDDLFLWSAIEKIQADGFAFSTGEKAEGVSCIATPVRNSEGKVVASFTMTGLFTRFQDEELKEKIADTLLMARSVSEDLGYRADSK